jgi:hypothetical protein
MTRIGRTICAVFIAGLVIGALLAWTAVSLLHAASGATRSVAIYCPAATSGRPALRHADKAPGSPTAPERLCDDPVTGADPAPKNSRPAIPAWETLILGSSVVAALAAAACNARAAAKARSGSLSDAAFVAYLRFNHEAHQYLARMEDFTTGRPSVETVTACYEEVHATLSRLPESAGQQIALLEAIYEHLKEWPKGKAGMPAAAAGYAQDAHTQLSALENSMRGLGNNRLRLSRASAGQTA